jgi:hypothetical protein
LYIPFYEIFGLDAAEEVLSELSPLTMNQHYRQGFYLAAAELHFLKGNLDLAKTAAAFVSADELLPGDRVSFLNMFPSLSPDE